MLTAALSVSVGLALGPPPIQDAYRPDDGAITFLHGTIGPRGEIRMVLARRGNELTGTYYYLRFNRTILVSGIISDSGDIRLDEGRPRGGIAARFNGRFSSKDHFEGTWSTTDRKRQLTFDLKVTPMTSTRPAAADVIEMPRRALVDAYGPAVAESIRFSHLTFSPSGRFLAFRLSGITTGDSEQVWTLDTQTGALRRLTEPVSRDGIGLIIESVEWKTDDRIELVVQRIVWSDQNKNQRLKVAIAGDRSTTEAIPWVAEPVGWTVPSHAGRYEVRVTPPATAKVVDVPTNRTLFSEQSIWDAVQWVSNTRFVYVHEFGHGRVQLKSAVVNPASGRVTTQLIHDGGGELNNFQIDPTTTQVIYLVQEYQMPFALLFYDLQRRLPVSQIFVGRYPGSVAAGPSGAIAYTADGCLPEADESSVADGQNSKRPRTICILRPRPKK